MHHIFCNIPFSSEAAAPPHIVFLPGWGFDNRILALSPLARNWICPTTPVDPATIDGDLLALVASLKTEKIVLAGWSLGATIALAFARKHPELVEELHLFSMRQNWPGAEIEAIAKEFEQNPASFLASFRRKCFLGQKDLLRRYQELSGPEAQEPSPDQLAVLRRGLACLAATPTDGHPLSLPVVAVHGDRDIIAPIAERTRIDAARQITRQGDGHLCFLAADTPLASLSRKAGIRRKFSGAASSYDRFALVQKGLAERLFQHTTALAGAPQRIGKILELGCGTGAYSVLLAEQFPGARLDLLDFAAGMLARATAKLAASSRVRPLCEDGEHFLARAAADGDKRYDLITSNATLQWFADLGDGLRHIHRLLADGGLFTATIFGPRSLHELGTALETVLGEKIELPAAGFPARQTVETTLGQIFGGGEVEELHLEQRYASFHAMLESLQKTGTTGWQQGKTIRFSRTRLSLLDEWFQSQYGGCRLGYQVFLVSAVRPRPLATAP